MNIGFDHSISHSVRIRVVVRAVVFIGLIFSIVFIAAGRWDYWNGWIFCFLNAFVVLFNFIIIPSELIQERFKPGDGTKKWDYIFHAIYLPLIHITPFIAALDGGRYHWTDDFSLWVIILAFFVAFLGCLLEIISLWSNPFFSITVRIQKDRDHYVVDKGPYALIRHPGYAGGILCYFGAVIGLNSLWALIPVGLFTILLITRTFLEDTTLIKELPGYKDYAAKVKYRLFPGIW